MTGIEEGSEVVAMSARGEPLKKRALSGVVPGHSFEVVWVARPEEWDLAIQEGRPPEGVPWPAEDVRAVVRASA